MAYIASIHSPSSVRHALKLSFIVPGRECLVVGRANRLDFYNLEDESLVLCHSRTIYGKITVLNKYRPAASATDHLFVGTDRSVYFTLSWDSQLLALKTEKSYVDLADRTLRESQTGDRCLVDPSGRLMCLELFEGALIAIPFLGKSKKKVAEADVGTLGDPLILRVSELFIRSSAFLTIPSAESKISKIVKPKIAFIYEDNHSNARLKVCEFGPVKGDPDAFELEDSSVPQVDLESGANHLIPLLEPACGVIILSETSISYCNCIDENLHVEPLVKATIFVAWDRIEPLKFVLADEYGLLYMLNVILDQYSTVKRLEWSTCGSTSRASALTYLGNDLLFIGSHQGDSQLVKLKAKSFDLLQTFANIAPILDFTVMDMGNRSTEGQGNDFSSGQARIVCGSGAFQDGSLRSVRSGVGLDDLGQLAEVENVTEVFSLKSSSSTSKQDILVVSFLDETRLFKFSSHGEVEELTTLGAFSLNHNTLYVDGLPDGRVVQVSSRSVRLFEISGGLTICEWTAPESQTITAATGNAETLVISCSGLTLHSLSLKSNLKVLAEKDYTGENQVSCIHIPAPHGTLLFVGFWQKSIISVYKADDLSLLHSEEINNQQAVPRSILLTPILSEHLPTLFIALGDGNLISYNLDVPSMNFTDRKTVVLGTRQASLKPIYRGAGLFNIFATCDHPSFIYGFEGRMIYSAVTAEDAACVCPFDNDFYPGTIAVATSTALKITMVEKERTTHVQTLSVKETVRRIAYSPVLKAFGLGTVRRHLEDNVESIESHFKLVDEVLFQELDTFPLNHNELVESVIRLELDDGTGSFAERFAVGTGYLDDDEEQPGRGRIVIFEVTEDRCLRLVAEISTNGPCRCLGTVEHNIVAALVKSVTIYSFAYTTPSSPLIEKRASYRTSTLPIDITVNDNIIAVADLMKSVSLIEYKRGKGGLADSLTEVARHFQTAWATAVAEVAENTYLQSDAEGNVIVLVRDVQGLSEADTRRMAVTSDMQLGEMVNRIRRIRVPTMPNAPVTPRAFLATVEGSIYLFGLIHPSKQDLLMRLQSNMAGIICSPGKIGFNSYRAFRNQVKEADEPNRFVDGDLIEQYLDCSEEVQRKAIEGLPIDLSGMRGIVEELKRLH